MTYRTVLLNYFRQRDRGWVLSLIAAVFLVYLPFLGNQFIFDDLNLFKEDIAGHFARALSQFNVRWLAYASLAWTYYIFSDVNTYFYRLGNVLLHGINVILIFYLLRQLVGAAMGGNRESGTVIWGAWFGALVFACHPVAVYAVGYIIQRSILLATMFSLVMQLAYLRGLLTGRKRWLALAVAAYFLAVLSKEHSILMPAVLAAMTIQLRAKNQLGWRVLAPAWSAFAAIGLFAVLSISGVLGTVYEPTAAAMFNQMGMATISTPMLHMLSILTQAGLFFKYLLLWVLPNPAWMSVDMREPFVSSLSSLRGWLGASAFILYGVVAFRLLLRPRWQGLAGLALLYPWLQFWVEFTTVRVQESFILYRSYLWLPGMMLLIPFALAKFPRRKPLLVLAATVVLLVPLAWNRLWTFADNYRLWNDAAALLQSDEAIGADRILYNRAQAASAARRWQDAVLDFERVVARGEVIAVVHHDLGVAYFNTKRYQDAIVQFNKAIELNPDYAKAYFNKGMALKFLHQEEQAMKQMAKSCELKYAMACVIVKIAPISKAQSQPRE